MSDGDSNDPVSSIRRDKQDDDDTTKQRATTNEALVGKNDEQLLEQNGQPESIETRKRKLIQQLEQNPERFWPMDKDEGRNDDTTLEARSKKSKTGNDNNIIQGEETTMTEQTGAITPSALEQDHFNAIRQIASSIFANQESLIGDTALNPSTSTERETEPNNETTLDSRSLLVLDRIQNHLAQMMMTNSSVQQQNGHELHTRQATNILGWLCVDLKQVIQASILSSTATTRNVVGDKITTTNVRPGSSVVSFSSSSPFKVNTEYNNGLSREALSILCHESLPSVENDAGDDDRTKDNTNGSSGTYWSGSGSGSGSGNVNNEDNDGVGGSSSSGGGSTTDHPFDISQLMCRETGLFAGDNLNGDATQPSSSSPSSTTSVTVNGETGNSTTHDSQTVSLLQGQEQQQQQQQQPSPPSQSLQERTIQEQQLAIIHETTRLIRTKTIHLTKRRMERNQQQQQM